MKTNKRNKVAKRDATSLLPAVDELAQEISNLPGAKTLTPVERRRTLKVPGGADKQIESAINIGRQHPDLSVGIDVDGMESNLHFVSEMRTLRTEVASVLQTIEDTILVAESDAWQKALEIYNTARRAVKRLPDVKAEVAGIESFLAHGPRRKASPTLETTPQVDPTPSTPAAPSPTDTSLKVV